MSFFLLIILCGMFQAAFSQEERVYRTSDGIEFRVETVAADLEIPWSIVFDQAGTMYFTERSGNLKMIRKGEKKPSLIADVDDVVHQGEGGLMGLALHPDFESNGFLYVSYTFRFKGSLANRVVRYALKNGALQERRIIVPYLPGSAVHNGCRLRFGPDRKLYVTTGDAANRQRAQDPTSLGGKILRLNDDGSIPPDNPDPKSAIFALGVRNPQGIDWHPRFKLLFETEHGPSGFDGPGGGDEVNIIEAGKNYGWPVIHHREEKEGYVSPLLEYTPAVAPASGMFYSGMAFPGFANNFFFGGLRGTRIQRIVLEPNSSRKVVREEALLLGEFGRIREVAQGPDGAIYFSTSNTSRGRPTSDDDRILRIIPIK
ncbi:MAG: PQQ-dependent sugar dehydrogenase [Ignavibacteriales bacterium]|nr:PQQ-dependent sugar dehydrogenase [Ignavibacteriales bacterium]